MKTSVIIDSDGKRIDRTEYPLEALREAVANHLFIEITLHKQKMEYIGINSRRYTREKIIKPLIEEGKLDYTNKNHINASNQKYKTIQK